MTSASICCMSSRTAAGHLSGALSPLRRKAHFPDDMPIVESRFRPGAEHSPFLAQNWKLETRNFSSFVWSLFTWLLVITPLRHFGPYLQSENFRAHSPDPHNSGIFKFVRVRK